MGRGIMVFLIALGFTVLAMNAECARPSTLYKSYHSTLSDAERRDISFIINTLADKSVFQLMMQKRALETAGDRVGKVHPLKFMAFVYTDPTLKYKVKKIKGMPWKQFSNDMGESLLDAARQGLVTQESLSEFSKETGIHPSVYEAYANQQKWRDFINSTRSALP